MVLSVWIQFVIKYLAHVSLCLVCFNYEKQVKLYLIVKWQCL